jgi:hypothetical protein
VTSLADLEAHLADYRAVLAKLAGFQAETRARFDAVDGKFVGLHQEMTGRFRSVDEQLAEIKDLIIDRRGGS